MASLAVVCGLQSAATAGPISYEFTGRLTYLSRPTAAANVGVALGDAFTLTLVYDPDEATPHQTLENRYGLDGGAAFLRFESGSLVREYTRFEYEPHLGYEDGKYAIYSFFNVDDWATLQAIQVDIRPRFFGAVSGVNETFLTGPPKALETWIVAVTVTDNRTRPIERFGQVTGQAETWTVSVPDTSPTFLLLSISLVALLAGHHRRAFEQ